jgi:hypothetical protein
MLTLRCDFPVVCSCSVNHSGQASRLIVRETLEVFKPRAAALQGLFVLLLLRLRRSIPVPRPPGREACDRVSVAVDASLPV